jgi:hypothetical protein
MTLVERTVALRERCTSLSTLGDRIEEARKLGTRLAELRGVAENLPEILKTIDMLAKAGVAVQGSDSSVAQVRTAIAKIKTRFAQAREPDALTKGQDWKVLIRELPKVVAELDESAAEAWGTHAHHLFAGDAPTAVERTLAPTDANKAALVKYRQAHERYVRLKGSVPEGPEAVAELARVAQELKSVKFDYDVPASVRKFLEALPAGAPLALLTAEVRDWIDQRGLAIRYQVVAANR